MSTSVADSDALICAFKINSDGVAEQLAWADIKSSVSSDDSMRWIHLNRESSCVQEWLMLQSDLDATVVNALLQEDTRPRIAKHDSGFLLNLRGVNMNPGESAEDMVSLRLWATRSLVISTCARPIMAAEDLKERFTAGRAPTSTASLIAYLASRLVARIGPVVAELDEQVDALEDSLLPGDASTSKADIGRFRRTVLTLRRYIAPQREAIAGFLRDSDGFLSGDDQNQLRDTHDAVVRMAEDLDLIRERALLLQEELVEIRAEAMNDRLFVLAIISAIFLPLGFVTGLFGVNVGGMPGVDSPVAFAILCVGMAGLSVGIVLLLIWRKWI